MSDDEQILQWVETFKETQRQMSQAHEIYQKALAESHQKYLTAVGHSQNRLLHVLENFGVSANQLQSITSDEQTREFTKAIEITNVSSADRVIPAVFSVPQSGKPFSPLVPNALVVIVADALGVAEHVDRILAGRGFRTRVWQRSDDTRDADVLLMMSGLQKDSAAIANPLRHALANFCGEDTSTVIVTDMGGRFGTDFLEPARLYQAAFQGLGDVLRRHSGRLIKTIDLDVGFRSPEDAANDLVRELLMGADDLRVGLPEGDRVLWSAIETPSLQHKTIDPHGLLVLTVTDIRWAPLIHALVAAFSGTVLLLGKEGLKNVEHICCDLSKISELSEAIDIARQKGPITHWIHLPLCQTTRCEVADFNTLWDQDITSFQVVLANTSSDPLTTIGVAITNPTQFGHVTASVFRALCVAENSRREGETHIIAVTSDLASGIAFMCSELLHGGTQPDVRYLE